MIGEPINIKGVVAPAPAVLFTLQPQQPIVSVVSTGWSVPFLSPPGTLSPTFWSSGGVYVGTSEPGLVTYAEWLASGTGYWAWIDTSASSVPVSNSSWTSKGGFLAGGTSAVMMAKYVTSSDGFLTGGTSAVTTTRYASASGGAVLSGAALCGVGVYGSGGTALAGCGLVTISVSGSSGAMLGGAAEIGFNGSQHSTGYCAGGFVLSGTASITQGTAVAATGGFLVGSASYAAVTYTGAGGATVGGSASISNGQAVQSASGLQIGGSSSISSSVTVQSSSGSIFGGSATVDHPVAGTPQNADPVYGTGGFFLAGSSTVKASATATAAGGTTVGGSSTISTYATVATSGGTTVGGSSAVAAGTRSVGGIRAGGSSAAAATAVATGGITLGGTSAASGQVATVLHLVEDFETGAIKAGWTEINLGGAVNYTNAPIDASCGSYSLGLTQANLRIPLPQTASTMYAAVKIKIGWSNAVGFMAINDAGNNMLAFVGTAAGRVVYVNNSVADTTTGLTVADGTILFLKLKFAKNTGIQLWSSSDGTTWTSRASVSTAGLGNTSDAASITLIGSSAGGNVFDRLLVDAADFNYPVPVSVQSAGGMTVGASGIVSASVSVQSAGGMVLGGAATAGGEAPPITNFAQSAGGMVLGGAATAGGQAHFVAQSVGGMVLGGTATAGGQAATNFAQSAGGMVLGGTAGISSHSESTLPGNVTLTTANTSQGQVYLAWEPVAGADSYTIRYSNVSGMTKTTRNGSSPYGSFNVGAPTGSGVFGGVLTNSYVVDNLLTQSLCYFAITAVNAAGESPSLSNIMTVTPGAVVNANSSLESLHCEAWQAGSGDMGAGSEITTGVARTGTHSLYVYGEGWYSEDDSEDVSAYKTLTKNVVPWTTGRVAHIWYKAVSGANISVTLKDNLAVARGATSVTPVCDGSWHEITVPYTGTGPSTGILLLECFSEVGAGNFVEIFFDDFSITG